MILALRDGHAWRIYRIRLWAGDVAALNLGVVSGTSGGRPAR